MVAACTSATIDGDGDNDVISQPDATSCIQVPTLEITVAVQSKVNARCANGAQALGGLSSPANVPFMAEIPFQFLKGNQAEQKLRPTIQDTDSSDSDSAGTGARRSPCSTLSAALWTMV
ncbi:hypothetical protein RE428_23380 [Marinobacter nanhaiticus D15-8W]|nr:hypothetical protein RE428_23380 [Marinobacter nanhaiticus D15-8W]